VLNVDGEPETLAEQEFTSEDVLGVFFAEFVPESKRKRTTKPAIKITLGVGKLTL
jgi:hypothetical protein